MSVSKTSQSGSRRRSSEITAVFPAPLVPVTTNSGRHRNRSPCPHSEQLTASVSRSTTGFTHARQPLQTMFYYRTRRDETGLRRGSTRLGGRFPEGAGFELRPSRRVMARLVSACRVR
jgi:hypothetical protein